MKRADLTANGKLGCINIPLLDLELEHIIPDELHLMLRVIDVLIQGLRDTVLVYMTGTSSGCPAQGS